MMIISLHDRIFHILWTYLQRNILVKPLDKGIFFEYTLENVCPANVFPSSDVKSFVKNKLKGRAYHNAAIFYWNSIHSQITLMARQLLHYHARQRKYEKRLGRYLTMLYRINAHRYGGHVKVSMGVLLEHAGISLDRDNPGRTREAIGSAFNQLYNDGVIGPFAPLVEHSSQGREVQERIEQHAYHWWDDYRRQLWLFDPPQQSVEGL